MIELQAYLRVVALSRTCQDPGRKLVLPRLFALLPVAITTIVGFVDLRKVSISSEPKSLLLSMCIDAPESTTNSRSSKGFETGAGVASVALSVFLSLLTFHAALRAHLSWCKVSSCDLSSNLRKDWAHEGHTFE